MFQSFTIFLDDALAYVESAQHEAQRRFYDVVRENNHTIGRGPIQLFANCEVERSGIGRQFDIGQGAVFATVLRVQFRAVSAKQLCPVLRGFTPNRDATVNGLGQSGRLPGGRFR